MEAEGWAMSALRAHAAGGCAPCAFELEAMERRHAMEESKGSVVAEGVRDALVPVSENVEGETVLEDAARIAAQATALVVEVPVRGEFTYSHYERSHGFKPRGVGTWAFQRTRSAYAYEKDLHGEIQFAPHGTLAEAKRWVVSNHGGGLWAVMP